MITNRESAIRLFESLTDDEKAKVLGQVSHYLTIIARVASTEGTPERQREQLMAINEIQHRALAQMLAYQEARKERYPDRDIFSILLDYAKNVGLRGDLQIAFEKALSPFDKATG